MTTPADLQTRIDSYLMNLRRSLGELPAEEVNDILREIRGHILERAEAGGELTNEKLVAILKALGKPEDIGPLYQADALVARARSSFSPVLIFRTVLRWAMMSVLGFVTFIVGLLGYGAGFGFIISAILKPIFPDRVGAWADGHGFTLGFRDGPGQANDLLGWWIIPVGVIAGAILVIGTTRFLRWMLRFARRRTPLPVAATSF
jgi:hypothetical protein